MSVARPPIRVRERAKGRPPRKPGSRAYPKGDIERIIEARQKALELRKGGKSYRQIARTMGVSLDTAHAYVEAELMELREKTTLDAQAVREVDLERCDVMIAGLWPKVKKGDPQAVGAAIRVLERRAKLLGHDAPIKTELVGALASVTPEAVARMSEADIAERVRLLMERIQGNAAVPDAPMDVT